MAKRQNENVSVGILGIGSCVPERILTNSDLERMVDTSDEWIIKRTGISERRIIDKETPIYTLAVEAARQAIEDSGISPEQIDLILVSTTTPDYLTPSTSCIIQKETGAVNAAAFDVMAACSGFIYGITIAKQFIETGYYRHVLMVSSEGMTKAVDWKDRKNCVLFGDGAGAVVLGKVEEGYGILSTYLGSDGTKGNLITIPCFYMPDEEVEKRKDYENKIALYQDGHEVFKFAVKMMPYATEKLLEISDITLDDVKYIIPHQANSRIIESAIKRLGVALEKVYTTIRKYGNISSASIPVAMDDAYRKKRIMKGDNLVLVGFGGGLTWGSALLRWSK
ncbi:MAG: ketoacyl-ACP synthase III [Clostridiaceae bacterium]|jgi:3-oxoacyl-[acyl-carrier-protein] synthase-3|nr:ketoacyl-ACP synthase III [Clostridiaceae bacterium]